MAQINFPVATSAGQQFEGDNGVIYTYVGTPPNGFWSGSFQATGLTTLDSRYLKLDSSNDPITAGLNITGGNVGIGTSSPQDTLSIGESTGTGSLTLFSGTTAEEDVYGKILFRHGTASGNRNAKIEALRSGGSSGGDLAFYTRKQADGVNTDGGLERMRIDSDGNVGIGTNSPASSLHIASSSPRFTLTDTTTGVDHRINADSSVGNLAFDVDFNSESSAPSCVFNIKGSERMRIVSGGNVGIGTSVPDSLLEVSGNANAATDGSVIPSQAILRLSRPGVASQSYPSKAEFAIQRYVDEATNGKTLLNINLINGATSTPDVTVMSLRSDGRVGIGTNNPGAGLHLRSSGQPSSAYNTAGNNNLIVADTGTAPDNGGAVVFAAASGSWRFAAIKGLVRSGTSNTTGDLSFSTRTNNTDSTLTERMRMVAGGSVLFGNFNESAINAGTVNGRSIRSSGIMYSARATTVAASHYVFTNINGIVGQILTSGTSTSFVESSDYRLKENVVDIADGITRVKQLAPKRFNFIADPDTTVDGFIAHEAQTVVPESVTCVQDATREEEYEISPEVVDEDGNVTAESVMGTRTVPDYQGIDQSKLVPLLTAALQEAIAKIETLETKVAALEAG